MAGEEILAFLGKIDDELAIHAGEDERLALHLLGRSALILTYGLRLMTKDVDVVEDAGSRLLGVAVQIFGRGGTGRAGGGLYLETVSSGLPPLPIGYQKRCVDVAGPWRVVRPMRPDPHDLIVTKLRRFHSGDREDIQILCDSGDIDAETLLERFELAHVFSDRDDPRVVSASANLQIVSDYVAGRRRAL